MVCIGSKSRPKAVLETIVKFQPIKPHCSFLIKPKCTIAEFNMSFTMDHMGMPPKQPPPPPPPKKCIQSGTVDTNSSKYYKQNLITQRTIIAIHMASSAKSNVKVPRAVASSG